jgi:hypothetical protein
MSQLCSEKAGQDAGRAEQSASVLGTYELRQRSYLAPTSCASAGAEQSASPRRTEQSADSSVLGTYELRQRRTAQTHTAAAPPGMHSKGGGKRPENFLRGLRIFFLDFFF